MYMMLAQLIERYDTWFFFSVHDVEGTLTEIVRNLPLPNEIDRAAFLEELVLREELASTAIGNGVAIPHIRKFGMKTLEDNIVAVIYLMNPIDWRAPDGKLVDTLFFILATNEDQHLKLLSEIAKCASNEDFMKFMRTMPKKDELAVKLREIETALISTIG